MSSEEIVRLRASPTFSPIFRIVIDQSSLDDGDLPQPPTKFSGEIALLSFFFSVYSNNRCVIIRTLSVRLVLTQ